MSGFCLKVVPLCSDCELCISRNSGQLEPVKRTSIYLKICLKCVNDVAPSYNKETVELARLYQYQQELN